ncbi:helix-turn-helix domain-containing protein [Tepidimonas charontis]|uniref:Chemotaxis response regulator protein-glutamate methylesterase n=1 Tax=Tepidimonas charontis TaxID=2267262 RepID=A0A554XFJ8_9BURK|nr:helix-turn-helix domain-containing protein [Tepidimonas charontis]TSE34611.1 Chemotaxis response regulator protein-glutamate methylesterase [Tepidimonas charontis]
MSNPLTPSSDAYYTTLEVARMLGMAVRSVQLMVDRGELQAWKTPGGHRRITAESLQRWLAHSRAGLVPPAAQRVARPRRSSARSPRPPRILLIEDSSHFQHLVQLLVRQRFPRAELHVAPDGITGLVSFGQLQPDLLIVDILLPGIDGASMLLGLRRHELCGSCGLIVVTALDEQARRDCAHALQGVPVVHKSELVRALPPLIAAALAERGFEGAPVPDGAQPSQDDQSPGSNHSSAAVINT